jgi:carbon-monoxide dehydrogenase small subunit
MNSVPRGGVKCEISFTVNGRALTVRAYAMARLLDVLRQELELTGTKEGCGEGECGACAVLLDGQLVNSCLAADNRLHALQEAFVAWGGAQCGICTPGMLLAAYHLLEKKPQPSLDDVREGLSGNLCRCTGYMQIFDSILEFARRSAGT